MLKLPPSIEKSFKLKTTKYEDKFKMRYVNTFERAGIKKGKKEGKKEGIKEGINTIVLHIYKTVGKNLETVSTISGLKRRKVKRILKKAGML